MTPLERILAEELPTGTFGDRRPGQQRPGEKPAAYTPEQQAANLAALAAAVGPKRRNRASSPHRKALP